jgi:hypothetical protein
MRYVAERSNNIYKNTSRDLYSHVWREIQHPIHGQTMNVGLASDPDMISHGRFLIT